MFNPICFDGYHGDNIESFHDMKDAGIQLCILKVSQGFSSDANFSSYANRAKSVGMFVGGYHFGVNGDGVKQADYFMSKLSAGDLMVLDFEPFPKSQMTYDQAVAFVQRIKEKTGNLPMLYYDSMLKEMDSTGNIPDNSILRNCPAWISRYGSNQPIPIDASHMVLWQYTGDGQGPEPHRIAGCSNDADLSVWVGNPADLPAFVAKHSFH